MEETERAFASPLILEWAECGKMYSGFTHTCLASITRLRRVIRLFVSRVKNSQDVFSNSKYTIVFGHQF